MSFIWVLDSEPLGKLKLTGREGNMPDGWDEDNFTISRNETYFGLFRGFGSSKVKFINQGAEYLQEIFEEFGTETPVLIAKYEYVPPPTDKYRIYFVGKVNMATYRWEETGVNVQIIESSLTEKLKAREDIKVNLGKLTTQEGNEITPFPNNETLTLNLQQRNVLFTGQFEEPTEGVDPTNPYFQTGGGNEGFNIPINIKDSDIPELQSVVDINRNTPGGLFHTAALADYILGLDIKIDATSQVTGAQNFTIRLRVYDDTSLSTFTDTTIWSDPFTGDGTLNINVDYQDTLTLNQGQLASLILDYDTIFVSSSTDTTWNSTDFKISRNDFFDNSQARSHGIFEVWTRVLQSITDRQDIFRSNFFGRIDSEPIQYEQDGEGALKLLLTGKQARGFDTFPSISLKELFQSCAAIWNIGLGVETINGKEMVVVEDINYFFDREVVATIHNVDDISKEAAPEWIFNEIESGYAKAEYEEKNGLQEYNNKFEYANFITAFKSKLEIVSKLRADGYGLEFARRKPVKDFATEDTKYDNENFVVMSKRQSSGQWINETNEDFTTVTGIFDPDSAYNLRITPGRNLRRHGATIRAGLNKYLDENITFQFAEQNSDLVSQLTGESSPVAENADIPVQDLDYPRWIPEVYEFTARLDMALIAQINAKPRGIIKFSPKSRSETKQYYYGWILELGNKKADKKGNFKLLRVDLQNPNLNLLDPEGVSGENPGGIDPPGPIDPTPGPIDLKGFDYELDYVLS